MLQSHCIKPRPVLKPQHRTQAGEFRLTESLYQILTGQGRAEASERDVQEDNIIAISLIESPIELDYCATLLPHSCRDVQNHINPETQSQTATPGFGPCRRVVHT